jgi:hypothetical protein
VRANNAAWRAANKERQRANIAAWAAANPQRRAANESRRRARKLNQICECCTKEAVDAIFMKCPSSHEVDHRIPLRIGGLHCVHNLQILTEAEHLEKTKVDHGLIADVRWLAKQAGPYQAAAA